MAIPKIKILFNTEDLVKRNKELAHEIAKVADKRLLVISVLKGSFVFTADLIREMSQAGLTPRVEFLHLSSYHEGKTSSGQVDIIHDVQTSVSGWDVLLIDDILESGRTLAFAKDLLSARGAKRVMTCVLLEKPHKRAVNVNADFVGFSCPDVFVLGYGMDVAHSFRELPYIGIPEDNTNLVQAGENA